MKSLIKKMFNVSFIIAFVSILIGTIFYNRSLTYTEKPIILILSFIVLFIFLFGIYKIINKKETSLSLKKELIVVSILGTVMLTLQLLCVHFLKAHPAWDWNDVSRAARQYVLGETNNIDYGYFEEFANNHGLLYFEIVFFKILQIFGRMNDFLTAMDLFNVFLVDISVIFTYLTIRKLFGNRKAIFGLIFITLSVPFYNYLPILYTDTVTMMFPIMASYFYVSYINDKKTNSKVKNILLLVGIGISISIGMSIKFTCVIMLIAIIIDLIIRTEHKHYLKTIPIIIVSLIILTSTIKLLNTRIHIFDNDRINKEKAIPITHWIMMGLYERDARNNKQYTGTYNPDAYELTRSYETVQERKRANIERIKEILLKEKSFKELIAFFYRKLLYVWSDATYYAPLFLQENPVNEEPNVFKELFYAKGKNVRYMFDENVAISVIMYLMFIASSVSSIKNGDDSINYNNLCIMGVLIFFLIWEASARYLVNFVPIFIVTTVKGFEVFNKCFLYLINKIPKKERRKL